MRTNRRHERKGNAAFTAVSIIALLGFATLTVDIGHARMTKAQLQNAVDAAAHAGVEALDRTSDGMTAAVVAAQHVGGLNHADGASVGLAETDVVLGTYDWDAGTFTANNVPEDVNAVVVSHQKSDIDAIFALVSFGVPQLAAAASSMAVVPPGSPATAVNCYLPLAAPACKMAGGADTFDFKAASDGEDTAGWARLNNPSTDSSANQNFAKAQLAGLACEGGEIGDTVNVMNGVGSAGATAFTRINCGDTFAASESGSSTCDPLAMAPPDAWPEEEWSDGPTWGQQMTTATDGANSVITEPNFGNYGIAGPIMLVEGPDVNPPDGVDDFCGPTPPPWNGDYDLVGFAFGIVYDGGGSGAHQVLRFRVNKAMSVDEYSEAGGGEVDYGITFTEPSRVQPPP